MKVCFFGGSLGWIDCLNFVDNKIDLYRVVSFSVPQKVVWEQEGLQWWDFPEHFIKFESKGFSLTTVNFLITITFNIKRILYSQVSEILQHVNIPEHARHKRAPHDDKSQLTIDFFLSNLSAELRILVLLFLFSSFARRAAPATGLNWPGTDRAAASYPESTCTAASSTVCKFHWWIQPKRKKPCLIFLVCSIF